MTFQMDWLLWLLPVGAGLWFAFAAGRRWLVGLVFMVLFVLGALVCAWQGQSILAGLLAAALGALWAERSGQ